jgi:predicted nucleic acid-binding protein
VEGVATESLLARAARLAVEIYRPVYDCVYLVVSAARGTPLATTDDRLRNAAVRLAIPLWRPSP